MSEPTIVVDSREQKPYKFPGIDSVATKQLPVGDYTYEGWGDTFAVERKSLDDLATSLGSDRLRFENEIRRANGYANRNDDGNAIPGTKPDKPLKDFVVVIEAHPDDVYPHVGTKRCPNYYSNIYPASVTGTIEKWPTKYDTLDFVWAGDREGAKQEALHYLDKWYVKHSNALG